VFLNIPVKQVMKNVVIREVREVDSVSTAVQLLDRCQISALPVRSDAGIYSGVISKSDIASLRLLKQLQAQRSPEHILVREIMNHTPPVYINEHAPVQKAIAEMHKRHIHRLFVADDDAHLIGVISTTDILRLIVVK
jgi:CBS domain-containing protein